MAPLQAVGVLQRRGNVGEAVVGQVQQQQAIQVLARWQAGQAVVLQVQRLQPLHAGHILWHVPEHKTSTSSGDLAGATPL